MQVVQARVIIISVDLSSFQLDACVLEDDHPPRLLREVIGKTGEPLIERVRRIPAAIARITTPPPDWLVIESAYGHGAHALHLTTGAIIASCPSESQIATISSGDWRRALGATRDRKDAGHVAVVAALARDHASQMGPECVDPQCAFARLPDLDEHELDAIGIALAWRRILAQHEAAA